MNRSAMATIFIFTLVVAIIIYTLGLLHDVEGSSTSYLNINVDSPKWIALNRTEIATLTIENKLSVFLQVGVLVNTIHGNAEVIYPVQEYVTNIPPRGTKTLDIVIKGLKEGEELVFILIKVPEYNFTLERTLIIRVTSMSNITINLYARFSILHFELYRRPERAEVYFCDLKASYLGDNKYMVQLPNIYKICRVKVSRISSFNLEYDLGEITVFNNVNLVIPDLTLSLMFIVFSWLLLIPQYLIIHDTSYLFILGIVLLIITILSLWYLDLFLNFYVVVYELLFIVIHLGSSIASSLFSLMRSLSRLKEVRQTRPVKKEEKTINQSGSVSYAGGFKQLETIDNELLQVILRTRVKSPSRREYGEEFDVPEEFRRSLRVELPSKMHLINCGADSCVFACGEYALKIPMKMAMMIKAGLKTPPTVELKEIESVKREVEKVYSLDHDNIVKLVDYSINPPILVYELADGSLADYKNLDLKTVLTISIQISEALRYIHSRGLVHGDIKPSNILVSKGLVKLGDFSSTTYLLSRASGSGLRTCTVGYCAPEQVFSDLRKDPRFKACENRVDIYQLANVILVMLGVEPLDGSRWSEEELESRLSKVNHEDLRELLRKMLAREPWSRPLAEEVLKSLLTIWKKTSLTERIFKILE